MISKKYLSYSPISCGGTHDNDFELALVGAYVQISGKTATLIGLNREPIFTQKDTNSNFYFDVYIDSQWVIPLEQKFTLVLGPPYLGGPYVGFTSVSGNSYCLSDGFGNVPCTDSTAAAGHIIY